MLCPVFISASLSALPRPHRVPSFCTHPRSVSFHVTRKFAPPPPISTPSACLPSSIAQTLSLLPTEPTTAFSAATILYEPLFAPLQQSSPEWLRYLVWVDFRVAVVFFVIIPLTLFFWSFADTSSKTDACKRIMIGYWQASSLLMLTVFLNISNQPIAAATGLFVQALIPVTLTWWKDLLAEIDADDSALSCAFKAWRIPVVIAATAGVLAQLPNQSCLFAGDPSQNPMCSAWLEPPHALYNIALSGVDPSVFAGLAYAGLAIYFPYLAWLTFGVVAKVGRQGRKDRNCFSSVSALKVLGLIDKDSPGN